MVPTRKQIDKVFVEGTYKYNVGAQVINGIISRNNYNKISGNK